MIRSAAFATLLVFGVAGAAIAQVSAPVDTAPIPLTPEPVDGPRCEALAVSDAEGVTGIGGGETLEAARATALSKCQDSGGKGCVISSGSCDPNS